MSDPPQRLDTTTIGGTEVELSERQLFQLAAGERVTLDLAGRAGPQTIQLTVTPPRPLSERE